MSVQTVRASRLKRGDVLVTEKGDEKILAICAHLDTGNVELRTSIERHTHHRVLLLKMDALISVRMRDDGGQQ